MYARSTMLCCLTAFAMVLASFTALAAPQAYPDKVVTIIVPFSPGGGTDTLARIVAKQLSKKWDHPVIVEDKPGAGGLIGAAYAGKQAPDGYTLLMSSTGSLTPENTHQFTAIGLVSASPYVVVVHPSVPAHSIKELVALARSEPGKLAYGSNSGSSISHLSVELFKEVTHTNILFVGYKSTGQALTDLLGGRIQIMFSPPETVMPHVKSGQLRALAMTGAKPSKLLPGLPAVTDAGVPGYVAEGWFGLLAPTGTPKAIINKINADLNAILVLPEVKAGLAKFGVQPRLTTPEQFTTYIAEEMDKWQKVIKEAHIIVPHLH